MTGWLTAAAMTATALLGGAGLGFVVGFAIAEPEKNRIIRRLQDALMSALEREARAVQLAEDRLTLILRYEDELEEDDALRRTEAEWKSGMDARIWEGVQKQIELHRARYATVDELTGPRTYEGSE